MLIRFFGQWGRQCRYSLRVAANLGDIELFSVRRVDVTKAEQLKRLSNHANIQVAASFAVYMIFDSSIGRDVFVYFALLYVNVKEKVVKFE